MSDIKTLKMYARNRKLPAAVKLSSISSEWISKFKSIADSIPNTSDIALAQRVEKDITGTEIINYDELTTAYNQRYIAELALPDEFLQLHGIHHLRFGVLEKDATIPFHLDEPYTLRFICIVHGTHTFCVENGTEYNMQTGELWFINGSFRHSVKNTSQHERIALLGKFDNSVDNVRIINELL